MKVRISQNEKKKERKREEKKTKGQTEMKGAGEDLAQPIASL